MKSKFVLTLLAAFLGAGLYASAEESLWKENYEEAKAAAKEAGKPVLLEFTGSDWCPPCQMMNREVLSTEAFTDFAGDTLVLIKLDFPRQKEQEEWLSEQNQKLAESYSVQGFPTFILLNVEGEEAARRVGYMPGGPEAFVGWVTESISD